MSRDTMKLVKTLSRLGIEIDIAREIQFLHILEFLNHDGLAGSLPHQSQHLCVSILAKDDYLRIRIAGILPLDTVLFVSGRKSSNGKVLFKECHRVNPNSYQIESANEINLDWLKDVKTVGICGATSTPKWLMEECREFILNHL